MPHFFSFLDLQILLTFETLYTTYTELSLWDVHNNRGIIMHTSVLSNEEDQNDSCNDDRNNCCQDRKYN